MGEEAPVGHQEDQHLTGATRKPRWRLIGALYRRPQGGTVASESEWGVTGAAAGSTLAELLWETPLMTEEGAEHAEAGLARRRCAQVLHTLILLTGPWILQELLQAETAAGVGRLQGDAAGVRNLPVSALTPYLRPWVG